jgi:hypothetical protein
VLSECLRDLSHAACGDVNVVGLEDTAEIGFVRCTCAQSLDRRLFVAEASRKALGKVLSLERLIRQRRDRFFYFDGLHLSSSRIVRGVMLPSSHGKSAQSVKPFSSFLECDFYSILAFEFRLSRSCIRLFNQLCKLAAFFFGFKASNLHASTTELEQQATFYGGQSIAAFIPTD